MPRDNADGSSGSHPGLHDYAVLLSNLNGHGLCSWDTFSKGTGAPRTRRALLHRNCSPSSVNTLISSSQHDSTQPRGIERFCRRCACLNQDHPEHCLYLSCCPSSLFSLSSVQDSDSLFPLFKSKAMLTLQLPDGICLWAMSTHVAFEFPSSWTKLLECLGRPS